uniref:Uncharacterized protein n=1 Tax=Corvus moneduloides TaxID=1196302 RepID=A0A8C3DN03_CORMO
RSQGVPPAQEAELLPWAGPSPEQRPEGLSLRSVSPGAGMELAGGSTISLWTVVAAVQALERSVAAHASRLFSLEHRAGNSEKKHLDCEKMVGEFGNQLESKCAALGTLVQEYGRLQRRLENMENLLKNRNLWILRLPPGVEAPAVALENNATGFSTQEWENLEEWQRELYGKVLTGKREALVLLGDAQERSLEKQPCVYKCERNSPQQGQPQAPQGEGEMFPGPTCQRVFPLLHPHPGEKGRGPGAAPASCEGLGPRSECGETPPGTGRPRDQDSLGAEEAAENEESFPTDTSGASPCWDPPPARGSPAQQQSQGRSKSYICSDCGKNFVCHSWLVRHQTSHTGERPYKCSKCDKTYRRKDYLLNHQRRHTGERLFQCPLCSKRFVLKRSLLKHQEGHMQDTHVPLVSWPCGNIRGSVMHSI